MANASQLFKDDEGERLGNGYVPDDNEMRDITGISRDQEDAYDREAGDGAASDIANRENQVGSDRNSNSSNDKSLSSGGLAAAESSMVGAADALFNPASDLSRIAKLSGFLKQNRKKDLIGGGVAGSIVGILITLFLGLIPLKIENMVQNLQKKFFATSENALQNETQNLYENYMIKHVLPSYKSCKTMVTSTCRVTVLGSSNPVTNLYKTWANAKLETKLATDYGIEFSYDRIGKTWSLKAPGTSEAGINLGDSPSVSKLDAEFKGADRATMRAAIKDAVQSETKSTQIFYRYKVGRLLEEKYGIKRCIIFCGTKDNLAGKVADQKLAAKLYLVERVIMPRNQTLGIALQCLLNSGCDTKSTNPSDSPAENGAPENSATDKAVRDALTKSATQFGVDAEKLISTYNDIAAAGFQKYLLTKGLTTIGVNEVLAGSAADKIPVIGWINMTSEIVNAANNAAPIVKKMAYVMNAAAAVNLYMMYRTYADEIHNGNVNATEVGSMVSSLGSGNSGGVNDPIVGGTASAEGTPLYSKLMTSNNTASGSSDYKCNDGKPVPSTQTVCSEESLGQGNGALNAVHDALNTPGLNIITDVAKVWKVTIGQVFNFANYLAGSLISGTMSLLNDTCGTSIPNYLNPFGGYCVFRDFVTKNGPKVLGFVTQWLFPNPFSSNMSGGRTFDMMAAGADVAGNDSAHTTLGGQVLTAQQVADITNQQEQSAQQSFSHQSFFARMFSTTSQYSLISRLAMDIPLSLQSSAQSTFANLLSNPFGGLLHNFSTILSGGASATATAQPDPFGVVQYGYPAGTIPTDPETYWTTNCTDNAAQAYQKDNSYNTSAADVNNVDPDTGMPINTNTNPCLLIKATAGVAGGLFDTSMLTKDDLASSGGN